MGLLQGAVGSLTQGRVFAAVWDGRSKSAVTRGREGRARYHLPMDAAANIKVNVARIWVTYTCSPSICADRSPTPAKKTTAPDTATVTVTATATATATAKSIYTYKLNRPSN